MKADVEKLDELTRQRLARLGQVPVDASSLQRRLEAAVWQQEQQGRAARWWNRRTLTAAAAAILLVVTALFFVVEGGSTPVVAAPTAMARLHRQLAARQVPLVPVTSIEEANKYLSSNWREAPPCPTRRQRQ